MSLLLALTGSGGVQTTVAQVATITLTGVPGVSSFTGTATTVAQPATLTVQGVPGVSSFTGSVTTTAQIAVMALAGVQGISTFAGAATTVAQPGVMTLEGVPGTSSLGAGPIQTTVAQVAILTLEGVPGESRLSVDPPPVPSTPPRQGTGRVTRRRVVASAPTMHTRPRLTEPMMIPTLVITFDLEADDEALMMLV